MAPCVTIELNIWKVCGIVIEVRTGFDRLLRGRDTGSQVSFSRYPKMGSCSDNVHFGVLMDGGPEFLLDVAYAGDSRWLAIDLHRCGAMALHTTMPDYLYSVSWYAMLEQWGLLIRSR